MDRPLSVVDGRLHVRAAFFQCLHHLYQSLPRRQHEGCVIQKVTGVHVTPVPDEDERSPPLLVADGNMQCPASEDLGRIDIRTIGHQRLHDLHQAVHRGQHERGVAAQVSVVHEAVTPDEEERIGHLLLVDGAMQRRASIVVNYFHGCVAVLHLGDWV